MNAAIRITDGLLGRHFDFGDAKQRAVNIYLLQMVAGTVAHDLLQPGRVHDDADRRDLAVTLEFAEDHAGWAAPEHEAYLDRVIERARQILSRHRDDVERVAAALRERKTLDGAALAKLCAPMPRRTGACRVWLRLEGLAVRFLSAPPLRIRAP